MSPRDTQAQARVVAMLTVEPQMARHLSPYLRRQLPAMERAGLIECGADYRWRLTEKGKAAPAARVTSTVRRGRCEDAPCCGCCD